MGKFKNRSLNETPIVRSVLPWTGRLTGDDHGYRDVAIHPGDQENPDKLVRIPNSILQAQPYATGPIPGICSYYEGGLAGPETLLVRAPMVPLIEHVDQLVQHFGCRLLIVDAFRPWWVQVNLWRWLRNKIITEENLDGSRLSVADEVRIGMRADDVGSYCKALEDHKFAAALRALGYGDFWADQSAEASKKLGLTVEEVAKLYVTFRKNAGADIDVSLDMNAVTAHGGGGAVDVMLVDLNGKPVFLGAPFDYLAVNGIQFTPAVMDYFDNPTKVTVEVYADAVARDPVLQQYCAFFGHTQITQKVFAEAQEYRRLLMNSFLSIGATSFSLDETVGEFWHFNLPNWGGNQCKDLPGAGNGCHSLLANVVSAETGEPMAVWSNSVGHKLAAEDFGITMPADLFKSA